MLQQNFTVSLKASYLHVFLSNQNRFETISKQSQQLPISGEGFVVHMGYLQECFVRYLIEFSRLIFLVFLFLDFIQQLSLFFSLQLLVSLNTDKLLALFSELPAGDKSQILG